MNSFNVELALGTAQFGMNYGIAGRGEQIPMIETRQIIARAWELGVRVLDTAPVYGDIEEKLLDLTDGCPFNVVSKIPAIPLKLSNDAIEDFINESIQRTRSRLGACVKTILFHRSDDLFDHADIAFITALNAVANTNIRLGSSCYSPEELINLCRRYPITAAQIPGNILDQRLTSCAKIQNVDVYLRSIFLQGILLLDPSDVAIRLPNAAKIINAWQCWCKDQQIKPLQAALSIAKGLPGVRYCVIGVDRLSQLEEIIEAWSSAAPLYEPTLAINDLDIIDPRRWAALNH